MLPLSDPWPPRRKRESVFPTPLLTTGSWCMDSRTEALEDGAGTGEAVARGGSAIFALEGALVSGGPDTRSSMLMSGGVRAGRGWM